MEGGDFALPSSISASTVYSCEDISGVLTGDRFSAWKMIYCTGGGGSLYVSGGDLMKRAY